MGILGTLYNGVSGMGRMGDNMQIIADNVSNVNSVAYKSKSINFGEILSTELDGNYNGNGVALYDINTSYTNGNITNTNISSDMAISGSGFFLLRNSASATADQYSRVGQFQLKEQTGLSTDVLALTNNDGSLVQGYNSNSVENPSGNIEDIYVRKVSKPKATSAVKISANIEHIAGKIETTETTLYERWDGTKKTDGRPDPISENSFDYTTALDIYDTNGEIHSLNLYFDHTSKPNEKEFLITCDPSIDKRLIDNTTNRYNSGATTVNKGAGALLYGVITFNNSGDLEDMTCWNIPADCNVDHTTDTNKMNLGRGEDYNSFSYNFTGTGSNQSATINFGTAARPQILNSPGSAKSTTFPATILNVSEQTLFSSVYDSAGRQAANGDIITFTGLTGDGTAVNYSYTVDTTKKVADLAANLATQFKAAVNITDGKLRLTDSKTGDSQLAITSITYADSSGNTPTSNTNLAQLFGNQNEAFATTQQQRFSIAPPAMTSYANYSATTYTRQDGYAAGTLEDIVVSTKGIISGIYSNGHRIEQAQLALARFTNLEGLSAEGENIFTASADVGSITTGKPGDNNFGTIFGSSLEMSNVDLGVEFASLIKTQRVYQANSKSITTADEIIDVVLAMKR